MNVVDIKNKLAVVGGPKLQLGLAKANQFSPQILTGVGIVGGITATVLIARATLKLEPLMDNHEFGKQLIEEKTANEDYPSTKERDKHIRHLYLHTGLDLVKLYGPGVSLGAASIVSVVAAQGIAQKRQVALVAAVKSVESAFQAYRQRVIEAIGEDKEADIRYNITTEMVEEDGKKSKVKTVQAISATDYTLEFFDPRNSNWQKGNKELNFLFLKNMQNWANDRLESKGYVYLNEVRNWLGFEPIPAGQVVGWLHKDLNNGDGYIDFGWDNPVNRPNVQRFLAGQEDGILLEFNVDGEINSKL